MFTVLIVEQCEVPIHAKVRKDSITKEERELLQFTRDDMYDLWWEFNNEANADSVDDIVHLAFSIGFSFRTECDRTRWLEAEPFEMYRDGAR